MSEQEYSAAEEQTKHNEFHQRAEGFIKEYGELVAKHNIDFATYPMFVPDGAGAFKIVCQNTPVDITNQPTKSPFMATE